MSKTDKTKLMVAAIDFGTTFSGWAFSLDNDYKSDPTKVSCKYWNSEQNISTKAPTTVLIKPDGHTLEAFGYEAEDRYAELADEEEHKTYYYFQRFKMMLFDKKKLTRNEELEDDKGKHLPAKRVFALVIRYLKDDLLSVCNKQVAGGLDEEEIQWVLTVPAIWTQSAKQFMRESAVEAGIQSQNLLIALEPEAASLYCKYLTIQKQKSGNAEIGTLSTFETGSKYMVVDAGGGTTDIIVHEVCIDGTLKEIYKANGGNWGGTMVDKAFQDFLKRIFGKDVMKRFKDEHKDDFIEIQREFEVKKRSIKPDHKSKIKLKIPISLSEIYQDIYSESVTKRIERDESLNGKVNFKTDKVMCDCTLIQNLFNFTIDNITQHLDIILQEQAAVNTKVILMVGGFSESQMLFEAVKTKFKDHIVLQPEDAGLAVLRGAVIFGHNRKGISSRISQYTYGFKEYAIYNPNIHPKQMMITAPDGRMLVRGGFTKLIDIGEKLSVNGTSKKIKTFPKHQMTYFDLKLYASQTANPIFVHEPECFEIGEVNVDCKDDDGNVGGATVQIVFGGTEFEVQAILSSTGKETRATFSFLD